MPSPIPIRILARPQDALPAEMAAVYVGATGPQGAPGADGTEATAALAATLGSAATKDVGTTTGTVAAGDDARFTDARAPTGAAGEVLSGNYPNPGFAVDMATQAELDAVTGAKVDKITGKGLSTEDYSAAEKGKLAGIAPGATANATDAQLRDRTTHTGAQEISTVTGLQGALDALVPLSSKGATNGVATLDAGGKVPESQLPSVVISDVFSVATQAAMLALTAERGDIAVRTDLNKTFALSSAPASTLGNWVELRSPTDVVQSVAGKTGVVTLVKADVGLDSVDNTADSAKPVSTAQAAAIALKAPLTGVGASGTWPIAISGQAGVTGSFSTTTLDTVAPSLSILQGVSSNLVNNVGAYPAGLYSGVLNIRCWSVGYGSLQFNYGYNAGNNGIWYRQAGNGTDSWSTWRKLVDSNNVGSYAPSLTGVGASGNWSISITGNAATAAAFNFADTRAVVSVPNAVPSTSGLFEFKSVASVGNPPYAALPGIYAHVLTTNGWAADGTGGWPMQLSFGSRLAFRQGTSSTTWGAWSVLVDSSTIGSYAVVGPSSAVANQIALYDGATGRLIKAGPVFGVVGSLAQSSAYTLALTDVGNSVDTNSSVTIPANASIAFQTGSVVQICNTSSSPISINITTDTLFLAGTTTTGTRTLAAYGVATIRKIASTTWVIYGQGLT